VTAVTELNIGFRGDGSPFALPLDAASARMVCLGKSGAGKTNADAVFVEEVFRAGAAPIVLDPLGNLWGLRSSADGEHEGIPVAIFGGRHGDAPLPLERATYIADLVSEGVPAVLDLSEMDPDDHAEFAGAFLPRLLQQAMGHGTNLFVVMEEADRFARNTGKSSPVTTWARAARNGGIGWLFSTHKPQLVHKEIVDTADVFVAMKMTGELAQDAIGGEIGSRIGRRSSRMLIDSLPKFGRGDAWFVPDGDWLNDGRDWEPEQIRFRLRETFHVQPPRVGQQRREPKILAKVDVERIGAAMAVEIEEERANDPEALKARIRELEAAAEKASGNIEPEIRVERVEVSVLTHEDRQLVSDCIDAFTAGFADVRSRIAEVEDAWLPVIAPLVKKAATAIGNDEVARASSAQGAVHADDRNRTVPGPSTRRVARDGRAAGAAPALPRPQSDSLGDLGGAPAIVIQVLSQFRDGKSTRRQVAALSGYGARKSTLRNALSALRQRDLIVTDGEAISLTAAGRKLAGPAPAPRTTAQTIAVWRSKFGGVPRALFDELVRAHPNAIAPEELALRANVDPTKSTMRNAVSALSVHGILERRGRMLRVVDELFPTGAA